MSYLEERRKHIEAGRPLPPKKEYKGLNKVSPKRQAKIDAEKKERGDDDTELVKWFRNRIKQLTGHCSECFARTETKVYQFAIYSVCHILEKRETLFPSVKVHPLNFIELCPDHHTDFDKATWEEREMMGCWNTVRDRLVMVYPDLAVEERRHFPESVLKFMEQNKPF